MVPLFRFNIVLRRGIKSNHWKMAGYSSNLSLIDQIEIFCLYRFLKYTFALSLCGSCSCFQLSKTCQFMDWLRYFSPRCKCVCV